MIILDSDLDSEESGTEPKTGFDFVELKFTRDTYILGPISITMRKTTVCFPLSCSSSRVDTDSAHFLSMPRMPKDEERRPTKGTRKCFSKNRDDNL